jgi:isopenicillin-N N-acyltransferase-like protein
MTERVIAVSVLVGATIAVVVWATRQTRPVSSQSTATRLAAADRTSIPIIELAGDAAAIGREHGRQLREQIQLLCQDYLRKWYANEDDYERAVRRASMFREHLSGEHRAELQALADAAGIRFDEILLANSFLDLNHAGGCSTIALSGEASPDGVARMGRNLDFPSMEIADKYSVLFIVRPRDRYAFAAVGWPGMIGVLSGMNEHGLTVANMEVPGACGPPRAMPYTLLYRTLLERCKTVDEALTLLDRTARQTINNLMIMDAAGNRAVAEITPRQVVVRRGLNNAALIGTNHQRGRDADRAGLCTRYDLLHEAARNQFGRIDVAAIERMLDKAAQGEMTIQSMVFEPARRAIHLATGAEATKLEYQRIDLAGCFKP